jgi:predicted nuclease of predicted toxin-antitoxin system
MNFLVDAQLPIGVSDLFNKRGHNSVHTSQLPEKNLTSDSVIRDFSLKDRRVVITKDSDFYDSFILKRVPYKVVFVRTGNIKTSRLLEVFTKSFDKIIECLEEGGIVELNLENVKTLY